MTRLMTRIIADENSWKIEGSLLSEDRGKLPTKTCSIAQIVRIDSKNLMVNFVLLDNSIDYCLQAKICTTTLPVE